MPGFNAMLQNRQNESRNWREKKFCSFRLTTQNCLFFTSETVLFRLIMKKTVFVSGKSYFLFVQQNLSNFKNCLSVDIYFFLNEKNVHFSLIKHDDLNYLLFQKRKKKRLTLSENMLQHLSISILIPQDGTEALPKNHFLKGIRNVCDRMQEKDKFQNSNLLEARDRAKTSQAQPKQQ